MRLLCIVLLAIGLGEYKLNGDVWGEASDPEPERSPGLEAWHLKKYVCQDRYMPRCIDG